MVVRERSSSSFFVALTENNTDVHTGNILLRLPKDMRQLTIEELYDKIGRPITEVLTRKDGRATSPNVPTEVVWPAQFEVNTIDVSRTHHLPAMLSDFGESFEPSVTKRDYAHTRPTLIPPESFFSEAESSTISFSSEIWTLACTIIEIMGGGAPFDTWADVDAIISEHVMVLGKLPDRWWNKWSARNQYFNDDATIYLPEDRVLYDNIEKRYEYCVVKPRSRHGEDVPGDKERRAFIEMLSTMLVLDPTRRATIHEIAECEWMQMSSGWSIGNHDDVFSHCHKPRG